MGEREDEKGVRGGGVAQGDEKRGWAKGRAEGGVARFK